MLGMVRDYMLCTWISPLFTEEIDCELCHGEELDVEGATGKDPCLAVECRVG